MWNVWRLKFNWDCLCPILFADRLGLVVVMRRALTDVTEEDIDAEDPDWYPDITCEWKPADCGRIDGRLVAVDYGLPDRDSIDERRDVYRELSGPAINARD